MFRRRCGPCVRFFPEITDKIEAEEDGDDDDSDLFLTTFPISLSSAC